MGMHLKSEAWRQQVRHDVKNTSWSQKVRHDDKKYIIMSKSTPRGTLSRQKVRHNIKKYFVMSNMHNFRKFIITSNKMSNYLIVRHDVKLSSWRENVCKVCYDVKKYVMT